jgi:hypothetical protein
MNRACPSPQGKDQSLSLQDSALCHLACLFPSLPLLDCLLIPIPVPGTGVNSPDTLSYAPVCDQLSHLGPIGMPVAACNHTATSVLNLVWHTAGAQLSAEAQCDIWALGTDSMMSPVLQMMPPSLTLMCCLL